MVQLFNDNRDEECRKALCGTDRLAFEQALARISAAVANGAPPTDAFTFVCSAIKGTGARERERRLQRFVERLSLEPESLRELARFAKTNVSWALNAVLLLTPAAFRQLHAGASARPQAAATESASARTKWSSTTGSTEVHREVALVGRSDEHDNNRSLLRARNFVPLHAPDMEALQQLARTGLCGIVIGASLWHRIEPERHIEALKIICEVSTILFIRIATQGLAEDAAAKLIDIRRAAGSGELPGSLFCYGVSAQLIAADLQVLEEVAVLHLNATSTSFFPAGLSASESMLIRLLAGRNDAHRSRTDLSDIEIRPLEGGRSSAKVFLVTPRGEAGPFVAKLGEREALSKESTAYAHWVRSWDSASAPPVFHAHYGCYALTYRLESQVDVPGKPAETLHDRMERIRSDDAWCQGDHESALVQRAANDLVIAVNRAVEALARLNVRSATEQGDDAWLHWPLENLAKRNISLYARDVAGNRVRLSDLVCVAARRLGSLQHKAITHGDVHGRNILIRDRTPVFIDFARSGPGHPCIDLARLDGTIRNSLCLATDDETECIRFFKRLYCDGLSIANLGAEFPDLMSSTGTTLWATCAVALRQTAITVAQKHGGGLTDFLAMTAVVASYSLVYLVPGSGVERALLGGVSDAVFAAATRGASMEHTA